MVNLCGGKRGCCPQLRKTGTDEYTITDDYGGSVKLTAQHLEYVMVAKKAVDANE